MMPYLMLAPCDACGMLMCAQEVAPSPNLRRHDELCIWPIAFDTLIILVLESRDGATTWLHYKRTYSADGAASA